MRPRGKRRSCPDCGALVSVRKCWSWTGEERIEAFSLDSGPTVVGGRVYHGSRHVFKCRVLRAAVRAGERYHGEPAQWPERGVYDFGPTVFFGGSIIRNGLRVATRSDPLAILGRGPLSKMPEDPKGKRGPEPWS